MTAGIVGSPKQRKASPRKSADLARFDAPEAGRTSWFKDTSTVLERELVPLRQCQAPQELISAQLILEESVVRFVFRHALTRQALYGSLLARERQLLHGAVARAIESIYAPNLERYTADLAYHFYEAGDWERTHLYSAQAGEYALSFYALRPAVGHFTRA